MARLQLVHGYPLVRGVDKRLTFVPHREPEFSGGDADGGESKYNPFEAQLIVRLVRYLLQQGYDPAEVRALRTVALRL